MKKQIVNNIPQGKYTGYVWFSDKNKPEIYDGEDVSINLSMYVNPFIIEANLYDNENKKSYSIRFCDGKYYAVEYSDLNSGEKVAKEFCPNRMKDIKQLRFFQYWDEIESDKDLKLSTLVPGSLVFVGFNK